MHDPLPHDSDHAECRDVPCEVSCLFVAGYIYYIFIMKIVHEVQETKKKCKKVLIGYPS